jgi:hypothetical protein
LPEIFLFGDSQIPLVFTLIIQDQISVNCGLPSRSGYLPQQPPRKNVMTRKTTSAIIIHSICVVLSPDGAAPSLILKATG